MFQHALSAARLGQKFSLQLKVRLGAPARRLSRTISETSATRPSSLPRLRWNVPGRLVGGGLSSTQDMLGVHFTAIYRGWNRDKAAQAVASRSRVMIFLLRRSIELPVKDGEVRGCIGDSMDEKSFHNFDIRMKEQRLAALANMRSFVVARIVFMIVYT